MAPQYTSLSIKNRELAAAPHPVKVANRDLKTDSIRDSHRMPYRCCPAAIRHALPCALAAPLSRHCHCPSRSCRERHAPAASGATKCHARCDFSAVYVLLLLIITCNTTCGKVKKKHKKFKVMSKIQMPIRDRSNPIRSESKYQIQKSSHQFKNLTFILF
jgi:hypothetical protein